MAEGGYFEVQRYRLQLNGADYAEDIKFFPEDLHPISDVNCGDLFNSNVPLHDVRPSPFYVKTEPLPEQGGRSNRQAECGKTIQDIHSFGVNTVTAVIISDSETEDGVEMPNEVIKQEELIIKCDPAHQGSVDLAKNASGEGCTESKEKLFHCAQCDYKTSKKASLKSHLKFHSKNKCFVCDICNYSTVDKSNLRAHVKLHTGEKPYRCSLCSYKTTRKMSLREHTTTHTNEKLYSCEWCSFKTGYNVSMKWHIMRHREEQPYKCPSCDYRATSRGALTSHIRTHSEELPFWCSRCEIKTKTNKSLKEHFRIMHEREVISIDSHGTVIVKNALGRFYSYSVKALPSDFSSYKNRDLYQGVLKAQIPQLPVVHGSKDYAFRKMCNAMYESVYAVNWVG